MPILLKPILALVAATAVSRLLTDLPGKRYLSFAVGCFYYVHPIPMTLGLGLLIFFDRLQSKEDANRFLLTPAVIGALVATVAFIPWGLTMQTLAPTEESATALEGVSWIESIHTCLATPLLEQYATLLVVFAGLVKLGWKDIYAVIMSALFFAAFGGQPSIFFGRALAGCIYGYLYLRHGFWSAVTAHSLSSAWALLISLWL